MTFSIVARCTQTGQFGMAVASSSPAVAARCAYARAGVGAAASQNVTDPRLGSAALDRLAAGLDAEAALDAVIGAAEHVECRQLLLVDRDDGRGVHTIVVSHDLVLLERPVAVVGAIAARRRQATQPFRG